MIEWTEWAAIYLAGYNDARGVEDHAAEVAYWEEQRRLEDYDYECDIAEYFNEP